MTLRLEADINGMAICREAMRNELKAPIVNDAGRLRICL
jgi:hypothetical protein